MTLARIPEGDAYYRVRKMWFFFTSSTRIPGLVHKGCSMYNLACSLTSRSCLGCIDILLLSFFILLTVGSMLSRGPLMSPSHIYKGRNMLHYARCSSTAQVSKHVIPQILCYKRAGKPMLYESGDTTFGSLIRTAPCSVPFCFSLRLF